MTKPKTRVLFVLDKSGSMGSTVDQAISGFNEQLDSLERRADDHDITCSLVTFDDDVYEHFFNQPLNKMPRMSRDNYHPGGLTALRDGIGYGVSKLRSIAEDDDDETAYLVVIVSDGGENRSQKWSDSAIRELIDTCEKTERWTFVYMGHSRKNVEEVTAKMGIPIGNAAVWDNSKEELTSGGLEGLVACSDAYFGHRSKGLMRSSNYTGSQNSMADFSKRSGSTAKQKQKRS